ncbi:TPR-like protein [Sodiomyces alkalinus F11]|uniref:TPR-like protein n=1 Tax=Sodiomyces alkalinus (strain CBS 110278 / VKM F-3762 / F11) TaxID=1314773 RepID=A0A3N2Q1F4_SODAK|nr:TPR-like protein [Sodiomyces alkalinus F11]ROT40593.1 TPR-like protein [Sodiomyces alkalinus F11]
MEGAALEEQQKAPDSSSTSPTVVGPAAPRTKTVDEVFAELQKSPLFMTELDEESEHVAALQALAYEGTPLENAVSFKDQGNECFKFRRFADAREHYTKAIDLLAPLDRLRRKGETTTHKETRKEKQKRERERETTTTTTSPAENKTGAPETEEVVEVEVEVDVPDSEEDIRQQLAALEALYANRAACALELRNYRACWLDGGHALRINPLNTKAYFRSARALLAVGRLDEAEDACAHGLRVDGANSALRKAAADIAAAKANAEAQRRAEEERKARQRRKAATLRAALAARNVRTRSTGADPEMGDARVKLVPDEEDPRSSLVVPVVVLYPLELESDFVAAFGEADSLGDHLGYMLPPPWDGKGGYASVDRVECFVEKMGGGLVKWGKRVPLLKLLGTGNVEIVDDVLKVFVLPKEKAASWVEDYKSRTAART